MPDDRPDDSDEVSTIDQLVDLLVYAPVGLLYERDEVLPKLIKRGRSQVQLARVLAQLAARRGQGTVESAIDDAVGLGASIVSRALGELATTLGLDLDQYPEPYQAQPSDPAAAAPAPGAATSGPVASAPAPSSDEPLPIAGYDQLKAKEIVGLVGDLSVSQRQRIRAHEEANRSRKTVLAKLHQLDESDAPEPTPGPGSADRPG